VEIMFMLSPHWERSPRRHGYWLGEQQVGFIGLTPNRSPSYTWALDVPRGDAAGGNVATLKRARRTVERAYRDYLEKQKEA
jgi:hypothetical protein